jgi:hypothetical protein
VARPCTVCIHPQRAEIDERLARGEPKERVANAYGLSESSVFRHFHRHLVDMLALAHEGRVADADSILGKLDEYERWLRTLATKGGRDGDLRLSVSALSQLIRLSELLAKVRGELDERPQINVILSPQWLQVRDAVLVALGPFPDAREAVSARLLTLEGES